MSKKIAPSNVSLKITVVGQGAVGKSACTIRFIQDVFLQKYDPTVEDTYRRVIDIDNTPYIVDVLDTAGQEEFATVRDTLIRVADGFLLVYAVDSSRSFDVAKKLYDTVHRLQEKDPALVCIGNKCDLEKSRAVSEEDVEKFCKEKDIPHFLGSAKENINVSESFEQVVREIHRKNPQLFKKPKTKKDSGCILV